MKQVAETGMNMIDAKFTRLPAALLLGACLAAATSVEALTIDYANTVGSSINFDGLGHFSFTPSGNSFAVTSGSAAGLLGEITGSYSIGAITTVGIVSSAPVTGVGSFVIHDGSATLSGTLSWVDLVQVGAGSILNDSGMIDLTGITYGGSNPDLLALASAGNAANVLTFQFIPAVSLTTLAGSPNSTSFSGSITTVPDGGATVALLGFVLVGIEGLRRRINR
jgi:hypothetical protein